MTTLIKTQDQLAIARSKLEKAEHLLGCMQDDPSMYFEDEMKDLYNQELNEIYAEQFDSFPFALGDPCDWIEENQPTDYRMGFADFDFDPSHCDEYIDLETTIEELENEIAGLEEEIEELENN